METKEWILFDLGCTLIDESEIIQRDLTNTFCRRDMKNKRCDPVETVIRKYDPRRGRETNDENDQIQNA
ncbi:hypothetical protein ABWW58_14545 [Sporolactobacillus sp. STCC-11]|uniref:hypothetical protein n=1 Tax=Sporolactobacillus caesalpiniae TaxID=3230362 RepID=UPI0033977753